ncbi:MAG: DUF692 domain-containing protein [Deltaproteobacteria bacterium]|nr:DUF692 domain-containing protein [Deltaproteobacteria bacterium]
MTFLDLGQEWVGMGLRREHSKDLVEQLPKEIDCLEIAPENYMNTGGEYYDQLCELAKHYPIIFHGLCMSVGSLAPLDKDHLKQIKKFLKKFNARWMSDHLCFSSIRGGQTHDLLPLPFTKEVIQHVSEKIKRIRDFLEMPFAIENVSYYVDPAPPEMTEWEFLSEVLEKADCSLLLDVNNIYVNSVNHNFDPFKYLDNIPLERTIHMHIAGHQKKEDFILDTHGASIIDPVWDLLANVTSRIQVPALIVERDNNIPKLKEVLKEVSQAREIQKKSRDKKHASLSIVKDLVEEGR